MTEIKILKYLIENNFKAYTIREISKNLDISYKIVYEIIQRLNNEKLISLSKIGASSQVQFNFNFNYKVLKTEIKRKEEILRNKNLKILNKKLEEINNPFFITLLFGSYTKKTNSKNSDIDICVICDDKKLLKKIRNKLSLLPLNIDLNEFTIEEFSSMLKTKEFNVGLEIVKNNIILYGVENYYNLIKN